jgi:hypothetical protein
LVEIVKKMRNIVPTIPKDYENHLGDPQKISSSHPIKIGSFREIVEVSAKFAFCNKDYLLFFRGQSEDYLNKAGNSTFYPSIYRGEYLQHRELSYRFDILDGCAKALSREFEKRQIDGYQDVKRRKLIQWSILQHYEVCSTPLLDFSHSLRVACSFAHLKNNSNNAFVFMFGFPYVTNRISLNSEHDLVNIRLLSICPPQALRPHFQEGYLAGTDEITEIYDKKTELDFNNRLIAKFKLSKESDFWGRNFHKIPEASLYPKSDPIKSLCNEIREMASSELKSGDLGDFLKVWTEIEEFITNLAGQNQHRYFSFRQALNQLYRQKLLDKDLYYRLDRIRTFRNQLIHKLKQIEPKMILEFLQKTEDTLLNLKKRF